MNGIFTLFTSFAEDNMRSLFWSVGAIALGVLLVPASGIAQQTGWMVSAGRSSFEFRDVSRHSRPVDASPITWIGSGPSVVVHHERASIKRSHRFDFSYAAIRDFAYRSSIASVTGAAGDRVTAFDGSYEYRRYRFQDLAIRGFDIGFGATGTAGRLVLRREYGPSLAQDDERTRIALGGVVAARLRRWRRVSLETWWINGLALAHRQAEHNAGTSSTAAGWGGGWYDEWWASGRVRLTSTTSLVVEHARAREYFSTSHFSNTAARRALVVGVAYAR